MKATPISSFLHDLAQQTERRAELGVALKAAGVTPDEIRKVLDGDLRALERMLMKLGLASQESMYFIPAEIAAKARFTLPPDSSLDIR